MPSSNAQEAPHAEALLWEPHATLTLRKRPEDVAHLVQDLFAAQDAAVDSTTGAALAKAAAHSLRNIWHGYTSMPEDFARPVAAQRQLARAAELFTSLPELPAGAGDDRHRSRRPSVAQARRSVAPTGTTTSA
ncbi:hypothetical protein [Actinacidiphila sp. ITFR-21]|uniref:hypothetical protein n=1 Tax=Actinacidiphila sp. ITFR-21 TaxID=3075199 RepID=UPI00288AE6D7|nr:hypothetical protein [Streptomyces sp. ITFR-21]WNI16834.1 hypothetical protein RLT57_15785 [Streptomyces sp. ITFR-21]